MFYGNNVQDTRQLFFTSWKKYLQKMPLLTLEEQIVAVIIDHPEYHNQLEQASLDQAYFPEMGQSNPFLHMGLHLAIRDQVTTNRPVGIDSLYKQLLLKYKDKLAVEHLMMEYLAECLWQAQRTNTAPNEQQYLVALASLLN